MSLTASVAVTSLSFSMRSPPRPRVRERADPANLGPLAADEPDSTGCVPRFVGRARSSVWASRNGPVGAGVGHVQASNPTREPSLEPSVLGLLGGVGMCPVMEVVHFVHAGLEHLLGASEARAHGGVDRASLHRDPETRCREHGILLGVHADAEIVAGPRRILIAIRAPMTSAFRAVGHVLGRTVVSGRHDAPVDDDDRANAIAGAVGALPDGEGDAHEVPVHVRAIVHVALHGGRRCFCTLPNALRGRASMRTKPRGTLNDASDRVHASRKPSMSTSPSGTMYATGTSPRRASGAPT